ncbi:putative triacylglycerol lipase [Neolecta irregularis DAH-3]|uniref:Putative triacylglycerol lipase n=1 Tax=Neolecta irregularis (strain DAH-3) TaxID=1198029 RepID=A0A1U7LP08_NEOID|nr:putative triacylglycerol lipase [Neolecta irregularis DAH-3]|eukprot:OLL24387.1 putative triacylglycerol lipase [Neolecta irregularis DAH-3]
MSLFLDIDSTVYTHPLHIYQKKILNFLSPLKTLALEVGRHWLTKGRDFVINPTPVKKLETALANSKTFEEWAQIAYTLDQILGKDLWRQNPTSSHYDYKLIAEKLRNLIDARVDGDVQTLIYILRSGLFRNLGNVSIKELFNKSFCGTKVLIEEYVQETCDALTFINNLHGPDLSAQAQLDFFHDTRQGFGLTAVVLHGGAMFGVFHLGVVKALYSRGLLPRIVTGTAVGAVVASLICIHTDQELPEFLTSGGIDLTAFQKRSRAGAFHRKVKRFLQEGKIGRGTDAYNRTRRVLNITVSSTGKHQVPTLLNFLTAPNVLIRSAASASNALSGLYEQSDLLCKDELGNIVPWCPAGEIKWRNWTEANLSEDESPYTRISELFNVNHFIVSQAWPYLAPFISPDIYQSDHPGKMAAAQNKITRLLTMEVQHRVSQLDTLGLLPSATRRFLLDDTIPGEKVTLVPNITLKVVFFQIRANAQDFQQLFENPTRESIDYWILKGEQSTWPAIALIRARLAIELTLDTLYTDLRAAPPIQETPFYGSSPSRQPRKRGASLS